MNIDQIFCSSKFHLNILGSNFKTAVQRFRAEEAISETYSVKVWLASEDQISPEEAIEKEALLSITGKESRFFHGTVNQFNLTGQNGRFFLYQVHIVPSFWHLTLNCDFRIFQGKTVVEIVSEVLNTKGISSDKYDFRLVNNYPKRRYCAQFGESDWLFISRLLEEEGIFYFFEHSAEKHILAFADDTVAYNNISGESEINYHLGDGMVPDKEVVTGLIFSREIRPGKITQTNYNFKKPSLDLTTLKQGNSHNEHEIYEYPGSYGVPNEGNRLALVRLEEKKTLQQSAEGGSNCQRFIPGCTFKLNRHDFTYLNVQYLLVRVVHEGTQSHVLGEQSGIGGDYYYNNHFLAIPATVTLRPERILSKPFVRGLQSAVVVGPEGEEIHTDEYGRVKVQFHWDREGQRNEKSSCWLRISQPWSGQTWGMISIPRVGDEVLVDFINGDPDRPIVIGSVNNAQSPALYPLPANKTQSGIRTRSYPKGGTDNFHELRFEDKKGSEEIYLKSEKDWNILVKNDKGQTVGNSESLTVKGSRSKSVGGSQSETVGKDSTVTVTGTLSETAQEIMLTAKSKITLKCGGSTIVMEPSGITLKGATINMN